MSEHDMDTALERESVIKNLTTKDLMDISFLEMLDILRPFVLIEVPEDVDSFDERRRYDYMLARIANATAYVRYLFAFASYQRDRLKKAGDNRADAMLKKKEALYEIKEALKLKYEAVSRKITVALEEEDQSFPDRVNYDSRRAARDARSTDNAKPAPASTTTSASSWGRVPG